MCDMFALRSSLIEEIKRWAGGSSRGEQIKSERGEVFGKTEREQKLQDYQHT